MPEVRPIDANKAVSELRTLPEQERLEYMGVYDLLKSMPTLDYEPVVHAHWERHYTFTDGHNKKHYWGYHCSSCGKGWIEAQPEKHYRCYYCGAKMDEEQK